MDLEIQEVMACLRLVRWHGVSLAQKSRIVRKLGSYQRAITLAEKGWEKLLNKKITIKIPDQQDIAHDMAWLEHSGHQFIPLLAEEYPDSLKRLTDPPLGLFVKGCTSALAFPQIAIVGSRQQTPLGNKITRQFSQDLVQAGMTITSGLAKGVDGAAHSAACQFGGQTIAVAGCGLDRVYPKQHKNLAQTIVENGCLVSEFSIGVPPRRENFPARNRIIAALSEGVLVIEAAKRSGSLITARLASELGKEVFAVPGSILSPQSRGCHYLIQQGAVLTESIDDIFFELETPLRDRLLQAKSADTSTTSMPEHNCQVLAAVDFEATSMDELFLRTKLDFQSLSSRLMELELDGSVARAHNGDYFRLT